MRNSGSSCTHGCSAHFHNLVFIFVVSFYFFFLTVQKHAEFFKGILPISSDICQNRSGLVEYVCVDYRFQKSLFHDPPKFRLMRVVELLQAVSHREDTGKRGTW